MISLRNALGRGMVVFVERRTVSKHGQLIVCYEQIRPTEDELLKLGIDPAWYFRPEFPDEEA